MIKYIVIFLIEIQLKVQVHLEYFAVYFYFRTGCVSNDNFVRVFVLLHISYRFVFVYVGSKSNASNRIESNYTEFENPES